MFAVNEAILAKQLTHRVKSDRKMKFQSHFATGPKCFKGAVLNRGREGDFDAHTPRVHLVVPGDVWGMS